MVEKCVAKLAPAVKRPVANDGRSLARVHRGGGAEERTGYGFVERFRLLDELLRRRLERGKVALGLVELGVDRS